MTDILIDFMRHGEPQGGPCYRGHGVDDPLSEKGWEQMWQGVLSPMPWTQIVSSPMKRCREFGLALGEKYQIPVIVEENFKEVGFGSWEGRTRHQIKADNVAEYEAFYQDPVKNRPEGAEPLDVFGERVAQGLEKLITEYTGEHILVLAHAGVIRAAIGHVMRSPAQAWYRVKVENGALTRFHHNHVGTHMVFHNLKN